LLFFLGIPYTILKEKCLYLMKISKRNTGRQTFAVMGLAIAALAVNYLFMTI